MRATRLLLPLAATIAAALPAAAQAAPTLDGVQVADRPGRGATVTVTGHWDRALLRRPVAQRGTIGLRLRRAGRPVLAHIGWSTDLHRGDAPRFLHRFRLTATQARGLVRTRYGRARAAQDATTTLTPIVSHLVDGDGDGDYEVGTTSDDGCDHTGQGVDLSGCNLEGVYWPGVDLNSATLEHTNLTGATLTNANLAFILAPYTLLAGTDMTGATVTGATFIAAEGPDADFTNANLTDAEIDDSDFAGVTLTGAQLTGSSCKLTNWGSGTNVTASPCPSS